MGKKAFSINHSHHQCLSKENCQENLQSSKNTPFGNWMIKSGLILECSRKNWLCFHNVVCSYFQHHAKEKLWHHTKPIDLQTDPWISHRNFDEILKPELFFYISVIHKDFLISPVNALNWYFIKKLWIVHMLFVA